MKRILLLLSLLLLGACTTIRTTLEIPRTPTALEPEPAPVILTLTYIQLMQDKGLTISPDGIWWTSSSEPFNRGLDTVGETVTDIYRPQIPLIGTTKHEDNLYPGLSERVRNGWPEYGRVQVPDSPSSGTTAR